MISSHEGGRLLSHTNLDTNVDDLYILVLPTSSINIHAFHDVVYIVYVY